MTVIEIEPETDVEEPVEDQEPVVVPLTEPDWDL